MLCSQRASFQHEIIVGTVKFLTFLRTGKSFVDSHYPRSGKTVILNYSRVRKQISPVPLWYLSHPQCHTHFTEVYLRYFQKSALDLLAAEYVSLTLYVSNHFFHEISNVMQSCLSLHDMREALARENRTCPPASTYFNITVLSSSYS